MTELARRLVRLIEAHGPSDGGRYMALALNHPQHGYYQRATTIGADGDFITAPEISQCFGELLGIALADHWLSAGAPGPFDLVELGPGHGTLMADLLRATKGIPGFHDQLRLHLVETSPSMRARQEALLRAEHGALLARRPVRWVGDIDALPKDAPLLVIGNEFLDALPLRQYVRLERGWHERMVGLDDDGKLAFTVGPTPLPLTDLPPPATMPIGSIVERSPAREALVQTLAGRIAAQGGLALLIDYGEDEPGPGDTFQAVRQHRKVSPLSMPGTCDLTSHVAFGPLLAIARNAGINAWGPLEQGAFLRRLGIETRLARLCAKAAPDQAEALAQAVARLVDPDQMGRLFKVMAMSDKGSPPAGFHDE